MLDKDGLIVTKDKNRTLKVLDKIHKASPNQIWGCSLFFMFLSLIGSLLFGNSNIFSASGGIITIVGVFVFTGISVQVSLEDIQGAVDSKIIDPSKKIPEDGEAIMHIANVVSEVLNERGRHILGAQVTALGTVVWAYGWLIDAII